MKLRISSLAAFLAGASLLVLSAPAAAHISVVSGPAYADKNQVVTFGIGHGCEGSDTRSVRIEIPSEVVSVRALVGDLGSARVELDDAGLVTAVVWEKPEDQVLEADTNYYQVALRLRVPNQPFTSLFFPTYQTCQSSDGTLIEAEWTSLEHGESEEGPGPAPELRIVPPRVAGWNQFTIPQSIEDLSVFFSDALIVWKGDEAFSANPATAELISGTPGVSALATLEAGDRIWVKY
jgi:hypothetical protein